jgi:hypothetical protein
VRHESNLFGFRIRDHDIKRIHGFAKRIHVFTNLLYDSRKSLITLQVPKKPAGKRGRPRKQPSKISSSSYIDDDESEETWDEDEDAKTPTKLPRIAKTYSENDIAYSKYLSSVENKTGNSQCRFRSG